MRRIGLAFFAVLLLLVGSVSALTLEPADILLNGATEVRYSRIVRLHGTDPVTLFTVAYLDESRQTVADWRDFLMFVYFDPNDWRLWATTICGSCSSEQQIWSASFFDFDGDKSLFRVDQFWNGNSFTGADHDFSTLAAAGELFIIAEEVDDGCNDKADLSFWVDPLFAVPEPNTAFLLGSGILVLGGFMRKVRR